MSNRERDPLAPIGTQASAGRGWRRVGGDQESIRLAAFPCRAGGDTIEDLHAVPSDKAVVKGLVRATVALCIAPTQPVTSDMNDAGRQPPVPDARYPVRKRKIGLKVLKQRF